jgi:hypothetical protein
MSVIKTADLYFAGYVCASGTQVLRLERVAGEPIKQQFCFEMARLEFDRLRKNWLNGEDDQVSASRYADVVKRLKALLHGDQGKI